MNRVRIINGYVYVYVPTHRYSYKGYVAQHRLIIESFIGRYLNPIESVHHINGNRKDNRIKNLFLFPSHKEHKMFENKVKQLGFTRPIIREINERWSHIIYNPQISVECIVLKKIK